MASTVAPMGLLPSGVTVKQEKPEDPPEIIAMAAQIAEANRLKLAQTAQQAAQPLRTLNNAPNLRAYIISQGSTVNGTPVIKTTNTPTTPSNVVLEIDDPSRKGQFSWTVIGISSVPTLLRTDGKYISVRIMEMKVLNKHLNFLHSDIYLQARVPSYEMTEAEYKLMNEINTRHCEYKLGRENFSAKDLVVKLQDAMDFFVFLDVCYNKLQQNNGNSSYGNDKCGFIRINKDSVIPYTCKGNEKYVPIFYFEGETDKLQTKSVELTGWELSYLKFCCKVQGIKNELFNNETCAVTSLNDIKSYFSSSDVFEEYWPTKVVDSHLLLSTQKNGANIQSNSWIRAPPGGMRTVRAPTQQVSNVMTMNGGTAPNPWNTTTPGNVPSHLLYSAQAAAAAATRNSSSRNTTSAASVAQRNNPAIAQQYYNLMGANPGGVVPPLVRTTVSSTMLTNAAAASATAASYAKVVGSNPAYNKGAWPNGYSPANSQQIQQMIAAGQLSGYPGYQGATTSSGATGSKVDGNSRHLPPPLIPVSANGTTASRANQRYYGVQQQPSATSKSTSLANAEIIDLSSPPGSPKRQPTSMSQRPKTSAMNNKYPGQQPSLQSFVNQHKAVLCQKYDAKLVDKFHFIEEIAVPAGHQMSKAYKVTKQRVQNATLACINGKPFHYNDMLMTTISDFMKNFAILLQPKEVIEAFDVLAIKLYVANRMMLQALNDTKRYTDIHAIMPLIKIADLKEHMGAIAYILQPKSESVNASAAKRGRFS